MDSPQQRPQHARSQSNGSDSSLSSITESDYDREQNDVIVPSPVRESPRILARNPGRFSSGTPRSSTLVQDIHSPAAVTSSTRPPKRQRPSTSAAPKGRKKRSRGRPPKQGASSSSSKVPAPGSSDPAPSSVIGHPHCTIEKIAGAIPPLNSLFTRVVDVRPDTTYLYIYGGTRQNCTEVTNDLYRLDLKRMMWTDMGKAIQQIMDAADPFKRRMEKGAGLPFRDNATSSLYHYDNKSFMLVFGGTDQSGVASNELFLINLTACTWEPLYTRTSASEATETSGGGVLPRCGAASTVVGDKLFIFGGWAPGHVAARKARKKSITLLDTDTINAYSVLDLNTRIWDVQDRPYPDGLDLGYNIDVYAPKVYKGHKLLLMRGRTIENEPITFTGDNMWFFNTKAFTFTRQEAHGDVPPPHTWYDVSPHRTSGRTCVAYGSIYKAGQSELPSDIWTFNVLEDQWKCANLRAELWNLDMDLQTLEHIPGKGWCLLGYSEERAGIQRMSNDQEYLATWNVCVTVDVDNAE